MDSYDRRGFLSLLHRGVHAFSAIGPEDWKQFSTFYFTYPTPGEKNAKEQIQEEIWDGVNSGSQVLKFSVNHESYCLYMSEVAERYPYAKDFDDLAEVAAMAIYGQCAGEADRPS